MANSCREGVDEAVASSHRKDDNLHGKSDHRANEKGNQSVIESVDRRRRLTDCS
jgi:hypothetical protein